MRCETCGTEITAGVKFCPVCGAIVSSPIDLLDPRLDHARQTLFRSIHDRAATDKRMSGLWLIAVILVPLIGIALVVAMTVASFDDSTLDGGTLDIGPEVQLASNAVSLISMAVTAAFFYLLIKRQNDHYTRESNFREALSQLVRAAAWSPERMNDIAPEMMAISMSERRQEPHRNPFFWVLVIVLPTVASAIIQTAMQDDLDQAILEGTVTSGMIALIVLLMLVMVVALVFEIYLLYFLTQTMIEHDGRWNLFAFHSRRALSKLGFSAGPAYRMARLPNRSMVLYIVLTLLTGLFALYWLYIVLKDPNDHFEYQHEFEDNIMASIAPTGPIASASASPR